MHRRRFLQTLLAAGSAAAPTFDAIAHGAGSNAGERFSVEALHERARRMASEPYQPYSQKLPPALTKLTPQKFHEISLKDSAVLWGRRESIDVALSFAHVGMHFTTPVQMNVVDPQTHRVRQIEFSPEMFNYEGSGVDPNALDDRALGFAGFAYAVKLSEDNWPQLASFLGKSYFRAVSKTHEYGLSARGLAIDINKPSGEEFPAFIEYWFVRPKDGSADLTVYALLDSPSTTGIYRFDIDPEEPGVTMRVKSDIYTRKAIKRLGVAPMSSMFLKGPPQSNQRDTIYPRMHDSDRLKMWRGNGEWITRPLYNPPTIQDNTYQDESPKGFGLVQHEHDFEAYRNAVVRYDQRPSLWIEPINDWGKGAVALVEMPTIGETIDNIAAFWQPEAPVDAGEHLSFDYNLYWWPRPPAGPGLAHVDQTWSGMGNVRPGWINGQEPPEQYARRFAVDFKGDVLDELADDANVEANITISRGKLGYVATRKLGPVNAYRAEFDWIPTSASTEPVTMRMYLQRDGQTLSETWLYQWVPPAPGDRHY